MLMRQIFTLVMGLFVLSGAARALPSEEQTPPPQIAGQAMLVLDASGSMWGQIDGQNKIVIARGVIGNLLADWPPDMALGLTAYGHNTKGDCNDIETLVPVGLGTADTIKARVDALNPKGKTPISASLIKAAEALRSSEEAATVILVTDGLETCDADPCAVAKTLEETGVDFTAHVVGFDVSEEEAKALQCIADNTGGRYFSANTAAELTTAMGEVVKAVPVKGPVQFDYVLAAGQEPLTDVNAYIGLHDAATEATENDRALTFAYGHKPQLRLDPGDYVARVKLDALQVKAPVTVGEDSGRQHRIVLNGAQLDVDTTLGVHAEKFKGNLLLDVRQVLPDGNAAQNTLSYNYGQSARFFLPPGTYRVRAKADAAQVTQDVTLAAGDRQKLTIDMRAGTLAYSNVISEGGGEANGSWLWEIHQLAADGESKGERASYAYNKAGTFLLINGKYVLSVKAGAIYRQVIVEVPPDITTTEVINLDGGWVDYDLTLKQDLPPLKEGSPGWEIHRVNADGSRGDRLDYAYTQGASFLVPAGKARLSVKAGSIVKEADLDVPSGGRVSHRMILDGGHVTLRLERPDGSLVPGGPGWSVKSKAGGGNLDYGYSNTKRMLLPAGTHVISTKIDGQVYEKEINVASGSEQTVVITAPVP